MNSTIEKLDAEIDRLESQIQELRTARSVVVRVEEAAVPIKTSAAGATPKNDCVGRTIFECCQIILSEIGEAHFYDVADQALSRGYSSNRGSSTDSARRSFFDILRRNTPDPFEHVGKGVYRLTSSPASMSDGLSRFADTAMLDPWVDLGATPSSHAITVTAKRGEPIMPSPISIDESDLAPE